MPHIASIIVIAVMLLAGCATPPAPSSRLKSVAIIASGDTVSYTSADGLGVSVAEIDGKPVASPYGPIELEPGKHTVTMKCGDTVKTNTVTVAAGEVYQFNKIVSSGVKGCVGSLSRVRSANP